MSVSLFLRANGTWYLKITNGGKVSWKSTRTTNHVLACKKLAEFKQTLPTNSIQKRPKPLKPKDPSRLSNFTKECLQWSLANHKPGTTTILRAALSNLQRVLGDILLTEINHRLIDQYKFKRLSEVRPVTVNIELRTLRSALYLTKRWGLITEVPITGKCMIKVASDTVALSESDVDRLIQTITEPWLRSMILIAVYTGLRRNELCRLTWSDFDAVKGLLTVHESKTGKARCVPVSKAVIEVLSRLPRTSQFIFSLDGDNSVTGSWVSHLFKRYCRKLCLSEKIHFHTLRHTCASIMVRNGVSLFHASKVLGHSSVVVTEKFYAHMGVEDLRSAVETVGKRISISK